MQQINCNSSELRELQSLNFVLRETALFLDGHPCDEDALAYFREISKLYETALARYESEHAPITWSGAAGCDCWSWCSSPWPWEI